VEQELDDFFQRHPQYKNAYDRFSQEGRLGRLLQCSAATVYEMHGEELGPIADEILKFVAVHYPHDFMETYFARVNALRELQKRFDKNPSSKTLGDPSAHVERSAYDLALLLSIVFTNHRFEIMQQLRAFLGNLAGATGAIAAVGAGTGYEIKLIHDELPNWIIEGYDTDQEARNTATTLLRHFGVTRRILLSEEFPLKAPPPKFRNHYDAIVLCELLEHLAHPREALETVRECLQPGGRAFVTMAINIAQEDHVFLYPDIVSCRRQVKSAGLMIVSEWLTPHTIYQLPSDREPGFSKGNYLAILSR